MAVAVFAFFGGVIGVFVVLFWASADALLGTSTLTETRALGVVGMSIVIVEAACWSAIAWEEFKG